MPARRLYIDGSWVDGSGDRLDVIDPATEEVIGTVPDATIDDIERAIVAARRAFDDGPWSTSTVGERQAVLRRFLAAMVARRDELVGLMISEAGSTVLVANAVQVGAPFGHLTDIVERVLPTFPFETAQPPTFGNGIGQGVVRREPAGVVAAIVPFNYPVFVALAKLGPALAAGCTVVLKPSPLTPINALVIAEAAAEAELPPGVLNVVTTSSIEASRLLTSHPAVDVVSFTGSEPVGVDIMRQGAPTVKKVVLELGGKSANIVFGDADLDRVVPQAIMAFTRHCGQGCAAQTRILVEASRHDELVDRLVDRLGTLRIGDPTDPVNDLGPVISAAQRDRIENCVKVGRDEGATVAFGGGRPEGLDRGFYVQPTLFIDAKNNMRIAQEEIFGPVAAVIPFGDDDEAVRIANDTTYGLGGAVWSRDPQRAYRVASRVRTGTITINGGGGGVNGHGPFGGYKHSGVGREFGEAGLNEYLETKTINWGVAAG